MPEVRKAHADREQFLEDINTYEGKEISTYVVNKMVEYFDNNFQLDYNFDLLHKLYWLIGGSRLAIN